MGAGATAAVHGESAALDYRADARRIRSHVYPYRRSPDQDAAAPVRHPVVVVGAGPVGLTLAIDLARRGQRVLVLDHDDRLSTGSRAICFAKRTLEVWDRLGVGAPVCAKGVEWNVGKVFFGDDLLYRFDLLPEPGHARPAFVNLQQYYAEAYLAVRAAELPGIEMRWNNRVVGLGPTGDGAVLEVDTPDGRYAVAADFVAACDGSRSPLRALLGQESPGRVFRDRFLIADVRMAVDFPAERWFWFDPPFHPNRSVLLHRQPDGVWRIDFQLGWDADPDEERKPERIGPRVDAMLRRALGRAVPFELEWASVYTFACQRMASFRHGRVLFAGDAAHGVSPFGARGANSGVQDADNLAWKLDAVLRGDAGDALLDSYAAEREDAADENIAASTRATDFITPKSEVSRLFRDAVLDLARAHPFARRLVNSGRLSVPATLHRSPLNTPDAAGDAFGGAMVPGAPAADAPVLDDAGRPDWLLRRLGDDFTLLVFGAAPAWAARLPLRTVAVACGAGGGGAAPGGGGGVDLGSGGDAGDLEAGDAAPLLDPEGLAVRRYDAAPGTAYLLRPDQHVCARWRRPDEAAVARAWRRALGLAADVPGRPPTLDR